MIAETFILIQAAWVVDPTWYKYQNYQTSNFSIGQALEFCISSSKNT